MLLVPVNNSVQVIFYVSVDTKRMTDDSLCPKLLVHAPTHHLFHAVDTHGMDMNIPRFCGPEGMMICR